MPKQPLASGHRTSTGLEPAPYNLFQEGGIALSLFHGLKDAEQGDAGDGALGLADEEEVPSLPDVSAATDGGTGGVGSDEQRDGVAYRGVWEDPLSDDAAL